MCGRRPWLQFWCCPTSWSCSRNAAPVGSPCQVRAQGPVVFWCLPWVCLEPGGVEEAEGHILWARSCLCGHHLRGWVLCITRTSCLLLGWGSVLGGRGQIHTYNLLCQRDTAPANITCQRNSSFSTLLGYVINSSLNDLKCEIYQPSVIFSVIYSIWWNPPSFGVEIKLVEFTFHSFFLLYSPGACLVFVFWMCI